MMELNPTLLHTSYLDDILCIHKYPGSVLKSLKQVLPDEISFH